MFAKRREEESRILSKMSGHIFFCGVVAQLALSSVLLALLRGPGPTFLQALAAVIVSAINHQFIG